MADFFSKLWDTTITQESFELLLQWLDQDIETAEKKYLDLRAKTIRYFQSQGCLEPDICADLTFSRAGQKLSSGVEVQTQEHYAYIRGIARFVLMEYWRIKETPAKSLDELLPINHPTVNPKAVEQEEDRQLNQEKMLKCLEICLQQLPAESREIFIEYHRDEKRKKIDHRIALSQKLGVDLPVLRNRIMRIRAKLENCIRGCLEQQTE